MTYDDAPPEGQENRFRWRSAEGGPTTTGWILIGIAIAVVVLGFGAWWTFILGRGAGMDGIGTAGPMASPSMGEMEDGPRFPPVHGFYAGEEILFIHTEASGQQVADMLTGMMGSPVLVVPSLADVPESALATVYVSPTECSLRVPLDLSASSPTSSTRLPQTTPIRLSVPSTS